VKDGREILDLFKKKEDLSCATKACQSFLFSSIKKKYLIK
jgi:hypothetical protein